MMDPVRVIEKKRDGKNLLPEEIDFFVQGYVQGIVPDYQMAALLMAVYLRGMDADETVALTRSMITSGKTVTFRGLSALPVDKHSTGGVGDKITIPLVPLVAACGVPVPMLSGRSLAHSGGTLDKLESIPGFRTHLSLEEYRKAVETVGAVIIGQTEELAPADRRMYTLRDFTGTVRSLPLITASILSKKVAGGAEALVLDVKCGLGAFMTGLEDARALGRSLKKTGAEFGLRVSGFITNMDQPIGRYVGNALEVREGIEVVRGEGPPDTMELTYTLGAEMLLLAGVVSNREEARDRMRAAVAKGAAAEKLRHLIQNQGGDPAVVDEPDLLPSAPDRHDLVARRDGFIARIDARLVGLASMRLGAGPSNREAAPDPAVGIELLRKVGDAAQEGGPILRLHWRRRDRLEAALHLLEDAVAVTGDRPPVAPLVIESLELHPLPEKP